MRFNELMEATNVNVAIINDVIEEIFVNLPEIVKGAAVISGSELDLDALRNKFPDFSDFFDYLSTLSFQFLNARDYSRQPIGWFSHRNKWVVVNLRKIIGEREEHTAEEIIDDTTIGNYGLTPRAVLFHEIRHAMQYSHYPTYMTSKKSRSKSYASRDVEIDAFWLQAIAEYNPRRLKPHDFARKVMEYLNKFQELSDLQIKHYYKKTLKYYANPKPPKIPLTRTKENLINDVLIKRVLLDLPISNVAEYDLRKIPKYDNEESFLFPVHEVIGRVRSAIFHGKSESVLLKNMLFFIPSLYISPSLAQSWKWYVENVHKHSLSDAIKHFETGMPADMFDYSAMRHHMANFYGAA